MIMDTNAVKNIIPIKITSKELNIDEKLNIDQVAHSEALNSDRVAHKSDDLLHDVLDISLEEWEEACNDGILFY